MTGDAEPLLRLAIEIAVAETLAPLVQRDGVALGQEKLWASVVEALLADVVAGGKKALSKSGAPPRPEFQEAVSARWLDRGLIAPLVVAGMDLTARDIGANPRDFFATRLALATDGASGRAPLFGVVLERISFTQETSDARLFAFAQLAARGAFDILGSQAKRRRAYSRAHELANSHDSYS